MTVCQQNLYHVQELQKRGHDKWVKPQGYALGEKVWLSSKYLKTKRNQNLEANSWFFSSVTSGRQTNLHT